MPIFAIVKPVMLTYMARYLSLALSPGLPRPKSQLWILSCDLGLGRPGDEANLSIVLISATT